MLFLLIIVLSRMIIETITSDVRSKWSSCSKRCQIGYQYRFHFENRRSIEFRSCFEQNSTCLANHKVKYTEQLSFIQEYRREYLSHKLTEIIMLLIVAVVVTLCIPFLASIYLFHDVSIEN